MGVFIETDGLYNWMEQFFKHNGYYLWGGDKEDYECGDQQNNNDQNQNQYSKYNSTQNLQENFVHWWTQLEDYDVDGNAMYIIQLKKC